MLPLRNAFLLPFNFTNFSSFLCYGEQCCRSRFTINYLLADIAPSSCFRLILVIPNLELYCHFVRHYRKKIQCRIFFHGFFLELFTMLVLVKTVILRLCESMPFHWGICTYLIARFVINLFDIFPRLGGVIYTFNLLL